MSNKKVKKGREGIAFISSNFSLYKILNIFLRISGIGSKFIIFTLLSKELTPLDFGNYSLLVSLITIMIFVLGGDFYNFSIRDVLKTKSEKSRLLNKLASNFFFYFVIYVIFFIIGSIVFNQLTYTRPYIFLVIFLCITEHLSQEFYRMLVAFNRVLLANVLLFIRTAGWTGIVVFLIYQKIDFGVRNILQLWLFADVLTILYVLFFIIKKEQKKLVYIKLDFDWVKKGMKISYIFFITTIFLKIIEYSNRFIVGYYLGEEMAGIFTFYSSISMLITVYINTIVISFELPTLIRSAKSPIIKSLFLKFKKSLLLQIGVSSVGIILVINPILYWQNKEEFRVYLPILLLMIIGSALMNFSLLYHFKLYIKHLDKVLLKVMVLSGFISIVISLFFTRYFGIYGAAISFLISGLVLCYFRFKEAKKVDYG